MVFLFRASGLTGYELRVSQVTSLHNSRSSILKQWDKLKRARIFHVLRFNIDSTFKPNKERVHVVKGHDDIINFGLGPCPIQ